MNNETVADIIAEMRREAPEICEFGSMCIGNYADRIEAAAERERGALVAEAEAAKDARNKVAVRLREEDAEKCKECKAKSGNAAAMRKALDKIHLIATTNINECVGDESDIHIVNLANAALAAPPRNCDVGTPAEQSRRFREFCHLIRTRSCDCPDDCPLIDEPDIIHCEFSWAHMPYEGGGAE